MKTAALLPAGLLVALCILTPLSGNPEARHPEGVELLHCGFDEAWDRNYDGWPDDWRRKLGDNYPGYVRIAIASDATAIDGRSLVVQLDGGGAYLASPAIPVRSLFSYVLSARLRTEKIEYAKVWVGIVWQTSQGEPVGESTRAALTRSGGWQDVRIGPVSPPDARAEQAFVFVHVERGLQVDLAGIVAVDHVNVQRIPQVVLQPDRALGIFDSPQQVSVRCRLTGISTVRPKVRFELRSVEGELVDQDEKFLQAVPIGDAANASSSGRSTAADAGYQAEAVWQPRKIGYGFYRVHATLLVNGLEGEKRTTALAVLRPLPRPERGIFGWSLPSVTHPLTIDDWSRLATQMGLHWIKIPVWYDFNERDLGDDLVHFTERLATFGIDVVGVIDDPPALQESVAQLNTAASIADIFSLDASYWLPSLDPIITRLSLRIRWWQFGADRDTSLVGYPNLPSLIESVRNQLYRFGQNVNVGIPWKWMAALPTHQKPVWQFVQWSAEPCLTGGELASHLAGQADERTLHWALIDPLPGESYSLSARVADLIQQMMAARMEGADAAFVADPLGLARGILDESGTPDELLLPFRTTATLLTDAEYLGSMRLPAGSTNHVFRRPDGEMVMVLWNGRPTVEELFLGENIRHFDPWGRDLELSESAGKQAVTASEMPSFVLGLSEPVTTIRIGADFEQTSIPSVFGKAHPNALTFVNAFSQGVAGTVTAVGSNNWEIGPSLMQFKAPAGGKVRLPFEITPKFNASSGRQDVRLDFDVQAAKNYTFSVWRHIDVGLGDIEIEISTSFTADGTLTIEQRTLNHTDQLVDFKCLLYAPNRRRQRNYVFRLGRGQDLQYYRFPNAEDLIGKSLQLRAEEIGGARVLNYHFIVEQ